MVRTFRAIEHLSSIRFRRPPRSAVATAPRRSTRQSGMHRNSRRVTVDMLGYHREGDIDCVPRFDSRRRRAAACSRGAERAQVSARRHRRGAVPAQLPRVLETSSHLRSTTQRRSRRLGSTPNRPIWIDLVAAMESASLHWENATFELPTWPMLSKNHSPRHKSGVPEYRHSQLNPTAPLLNVGLPLPENY
jgi:hypothetical protein